MTVLLEDAAMARQADAQWLAAALSSPSTTSWPAILCACHLTFHEAEAWCRQAGRWLPSEVEWERAAKAHRFNGLG